MEIYGYARVSTEEQNIDRQIIQLKEYGIKEKNILIDRQSGKDFNRKAYNLLAGTDVSASLLREGDLLVVTSLDRFGRNYKEIQEQWRRITKEIGADIKILDMPLLDTTNTTGSIDKAFISDMTLQILSYVSEKERAFTKRRQREGIDAAMAAGMEFGRPKKELPSNYKDIIKQWREGKITLDEVLKVFKISKSTLYRILEQERERGHSQKVGLRKGLL